MSFQVWLDKHMTRYPTDVRIWLNQPEQKLIREMVVLQLERDYWYEQYCHIKGLTVVNPLAPC